MAYHIPTITEEEYETLKRILNRVVRAPDPEPTEEELRSAAQRHSQHVQPKLAPIGTKELREVILRGIPIKLTVESIFNIQKTEFCYRVCLNWTDSVGQRWKYSPSFPIQAENPSEWRSALFRRLRFYRISKGEAKSLADEGLELMLEFHGERMEKTHRALLTQLTQRKGNVYVPPVIIKPVYEEKDSSQIT